MKVLLDESVPRGLRQILATKHQVKTLHELGWAGQRNGKLLSSAASAEFAVIVTTDPTIVQRQQLAELNLGIVLLPSNNWRALSAMSAEVFAAVDEAKPGNVYDVKALLIR